LQEHHFLATKKTLAYKTMFVPDLQSHYFNQLESASFSIWSSCIWHFQLQLLNVKSELVMVRRNSAWKSFEKICLP